MVDMPFVTATLIPTITPRPSATWTSPTNAPSIAPILASLTAQVNVRKSPDINADLLGMVNLGSRVQVIGKNGNGAWWQIIYPENTTSTGWITSEYVEVSEIDGEKIPLVLSDGQTLTPQADVTMETQKTPEITAQITISKNTARVTKEMFVRLGPAQTFGTQGTVAAGLILNLTGRNQNNVWVQIEYESGKDGKGWVASAYLENADLDDLPIFDNQGNLIYEGNPEIEGLTLTPSVAILPPAAADGDSEENPAARMFFAPYGTKEFIFSSDLSFPSGDSMDWVAFTPYESMNSATYVFLRLECKGNGGITVTLQKDGKPVPETQTVGCGNYDFALRVIGGQEYFLILTADGSGGSLRYAQYNLSIRSER